jgi:retinol dehydrogenase-14
VGFVAVIVGLLFSSIPANLGFYRWLVTIEPAYTALSPAFLPDDYKWGYTFEQLHNNDLTGQHAIVTGANSGVGYESALALAKLGASVTLACRNSQKCDAAAAKIRAAGGSKVQTSVLDTSDLTSVRAFAQKYLQDKENEPLDMLYLNAGIYSTGANKDGSTPLSVDGIEIVFATNHVGHHLLYKLLEPAVLKSKLARVVLTSSAASFDTFEYKVADGLLTLNGVSAQKNNMQIYGQSKLAQVLFAKELTRRLGDNSSVYVNAAHPGAVDTAIWDGNPFIPDFIRGVVNYAKKTVMWTGAEGALTMLYLGVATDELVAKNVRGKYFHPQSQEVVNPSALDEDLQKRVWNFSDELVKDFV